MDMWGAIRDERLDLADRLIGLSSDEWNTASLCRAWRVRDVIAHVAAGAEGAYGAVALFGGMLRYGFSFSRWMASDGQARGERDPELTLQALRNAAGNRKSPPGAPTVSVLTDVLVHGQDVCRPLGIQRNLPEDHVRAVADFVKSTFVFSAKKRIADLKLTATDMDWSTGQGQQVTGPAEALVLVMAGRSAVLDDLAGDGLPALVSRFQA
jgi:uncharacterized protein (TIGR03083 family)